MTVLRCTAKLLKRLKQPAKPSEPTPQDNPLGEWYADIDFWNRKPFVVMLNGSTGVTLVLNGDAAHLRVLHERAAVQFDSLCAFFGLAGESARAEVHGFDAGLNFAPTRDRSLLSSLSQRRFEAWMGFEHQNLSLVDASARFWNGLYKHPSLSRNRRYDMDYHRPLDLLRQRLLPAADILPLNATRH